MENNWNRNFNKNLFLGQKIVVYLHNEILLSNQKEKLMSFVATWLEVGATRTHGLYKSEKG